MKREITIRSLAGRGELTLRQGDAGGYWLGTVDWGQVPGQHQEYRHLNQVGSTIVGTIVGTRALSIVGWVLDGGTGDLRERCAFLNAFFSPVEDYILEYEGKKIQFRPDSSIQYPPEYRQNNEKVRKFLLQATCPFPLFSDRTDMAVAFDSTGKLFRFPTNFGQEAPLVMGSQNRAYTAETNNTGGFQTGITARLRFSGTVENPRIRNLTSGKYIGVNRAFHKGELLEISTLPGEKRMTLYPAQGEPENLIRYRDFGGEWIQLLPGRNLLALECANPDQRLSMAVTLFYTPLYLEVE